VVESVRERLENVNRKIEEIKDKKESKQIDVRAFKTVEHIWKRQQTSQSLRLKETEEKLYPI
jgi:hypothetical protein